MEIRQDNSQATISCSDSENLQPRTFVSKLKLIKNRLRAPISEDRLVCLTLLSIESAIQYRTILKNSEVHFEAGQPLRAVGRLEEDSKFSV